MQLLTHHASLDECQESHAIQSVSQYKDSTTDTRFLDRDFPTINHN